jgi:diguanylate cyclase (GGDEF)-like protein
MPMKFADVGSKKATRNRTLFGFGALLALAAMVAAGFVNTLRAAEQRREAQAWYVNTFRVLIVASELRSAINAALRGERGYLLTGNPVFLEPYETGAASAPILEAELAMLTRDNPRQRHAVATLDLRLRRYLAVLAHTVALQKRQDGPAALAIVRSGIGRRHVEDLLAALQRVDNEEHRLLEARKVLSDAASARTERMDLALIAMIALLLLMVAGVGASAVRSGRRANVAVEELRRLATTDELTGLVNRRQFLALLEVEVARTRRSGRPLSLAILDVDHFKRVNDLHGHPAGDEVLRMLAASLRGTGRAGDILGRMGGEEFAVLMPETSLGEARVACERLGSAVAACETELPTGRRVSVTLSTGVGPLVGKERADQLVSRVDAALYEAKANGRNRVSLAA